MTRNGKHTTYRNGDDWRMIHGIVLPTLVLITLCIDSETNQF